MYLCFVDVSVMTLMPNIQSLLQCKSLALFIIVLADGNVKDLCTTYGVCVSHVLILLVLILLVLICSMCGMVFVSFRNHQMICRILFAFRVAAGILGAMHCVGRPV